MSGAGSTLAGRILAEVKEINVIADRVSSGWTKVQATNDDYYVDGVALNLHGFYSGVERILERIATHVDEAIPSGANWHQELLNQVSVEIPGVRPAVISSDLREDLEEYRGFRHVVRNVYAYRFSAEKISGLVTKLPQVVSMINAELSGFARFLQNAEQRD